MSVQDILSEEWGDLMLCKFPSSSVVKGRGVLLTMRDGSQWFHPVDGSAPVKVESLTDADEKDDQQ
jgi:hypothetical protein